MVSAQKIKQLILYVILTSLAFIFLIPLFWMGSTSLKIPSQIFTMPPVWIPDPIVWENYPRALNFFPFFLYLRNTLFIVGMNVIGAVLSCSMVAYGFSCIQWPGRDVMFILVLSTMMLPFHITLVPVYIVFKHLGWINTFAPLILPNWFALSVFFVFLLRQFFRGIPAELFDSARVDGCSNFGIYWKIVLPLSKPALFTVGLFEFLWSWNDFLRPLIFLADPQKYTLSLGLKFFMGLHSAEWALLMAVSAVTIIPIIIIFFFTQKTFIQGIATTGLKG